MPEITEHCILEGKSDLAKGILTGVKICGMLSANNRKYSPKVFQKAAKLYEGSKVYLNHPVVLNGKRQPRRAEEHFGKLVNFRQDKDGTPRADLQHLTTHPMAARIHEDTEKGLGCYGLSHNITAEVAKDKDSGMEDVQDITNVLSVDIVTNPATTKSMTEAVDETELVIESADITELKKQVEDLTAQVKTLTEAKPPVQNKAVAKLIAAVKPKAAEDRQEQVHDDGIPKEKKDLRKWMRSRN